ncbi:MAG: hypothetical protein ACREVA_02860 [Burkholderiales bacterium]
MARFNFVAVEYLIYPHEVFGRVIQGAHFLSHQLWTALICWLVMLALYELLLRRQPITEEEAASQAL